MIIRTCSAPGCSTKEFRKVGYCWKHKDQYEHIPLDDNWWEENQNTSEEESNIEEHSKKNNFIYAIEAIAIIVFILSQ